MSRINVYHHEIEWMARRGWESVTKEAEDNIWYGVRFYTEDVLEHQPGDDDSAAITLWAPWTKRNGADTSALRRIAFDLMTACDEIDEAENNRKAAL